MSYLAPVITVGGEGGLPFSFIGAETGALLKKLDAWVGPNQVSGITLQMSDGAQKTYGTVKKSGDKMVSFTFEDGEYFSSLTLWPNNAGDHLGAIKFETTKGRISKACMTSGEPTRSPTPVDVGSGMCFGVQGRSGSEIDAFGFMLCTKTQIFNNKNTIVKRPRKTQTLTQQMIGHAKARTPSSYSSSVCSPDSATSPVGQSHGVHQQKLTPFCCPVWENIRLCFI
uniref:Jacalin-type lectin domain-containing protein n=1 Tax=Oryzias latipes TaxID=8090 RepID=A0A3P9KIK5_ORYLA